jgi:hypothetical protein
MKNKMMRIASVLLVAALITTCAISGTFAKYVTKVSGEDYARVAQWGIVLTLNGDEAFGTQYVAHDETYKAALKEGESAPLYSVISSNEDKVVAPGTSAKDLDMLLTATVKGTPEVAARYILIADVEKDIVLPAGDYTDYTELVKGNDGYGYTKTFNLEKDYAPVKWDLTIAKGEVSDTNPGLSVAALLYANLPEANLAQAEAYGLTEKGCSIFDAVMILKKVASNDLYKKVVDAALGSVVSGGRNFQLDIDDEGKLTLSYDFDPNKEMDFTFILDWKWEFSDAQSETEITLNDKADTFLGNWAAVEVGEQEIEGFEAPDEPASYEIEATLEAYAVQID